MELKSNDMSNMQALRNHYVRIIWRFIYLKRKIYAIKRLSQEVLFVKKSPTTINEQLQQSPDRCQIQLSDQISQIVQSRASFQKSTRPDTQISTNRSNQCGIQKVIDIRRRNKSIDYSATISTHRKQNSILLNEIKTELQNPEYNVSSTTGFYQQRNIKYPQRFTQNYHYQQQLQNQQISQNLLVSPKQQHRIQQRLRNKPRKKYIHLSNLPSDFTISSTHLDQHNNNNGVDEYTIHLQSPKKTSILNKRQKSFELLRQENRADLEEQLVKLNNTLMEYQQSTQHLRNNSVSLLQQNINNQVDKKVQNKHKKSSKSSANLVQALNTTFNPTNRLTQQQQTTKESILQDQPNKPQFLFKKRKSKHRKHNKSQIFKMLLGEGDLMNNEHRDIIKRKIIEMNEKSTQKFTAMLDGTIKPKRSLLILEDNVKRNKAITKIV